MTSATLWERDNCTCPICVHPSSHERIVTVIDEGDGPHAPVPEGTERADAAVVSPRPVATRNSGMPLPIVSFADLAGDAGLERWLVALLESGVAIVTETPNLDGEVVRLAERIGYACPTNFGTIFDVVSKPDPNSNAYTALGLEMHTDLPYYERPPDYQFLHALEADALGGESLLVDGIAVAEMLREEDPDAFELLCSWEVPFRFHDDVDDLRGVYPVLDSRHGEVVRIRFNNGVRDVDWAARGADGEAFYSAYLTYWRLVREQGISVRLRAGEVLCFDNRRVLHGRAAFDPSSGRRHLQGCYVDRDMVLSRLRAVRQRRG
jgi:gamma-butyrobetaine dioxygenase